MKSLNLVKVFLLITMLLPLVSNAGNGVERGRVVLGRDFHLDKEIKSYIGKKMVKCTKDISNDYFLVKNVEIEEDNVDQGITDLYYTVEMEHKNKLGKTLNKVAVEVEDADYSNWRKYEEKLSLKFLVDKNKLCR